jgi:hypothetical protein
MPYYIVPAVIDEDSTRPDLPGGTGWVGQPHEDSYLVLTYPPIPGVEPLDSEALAAACAARGLEVECVLAWRVGTHGGEDVV